MTGQTSIMKRRCGSAARGARPLPLLLLPVQAALMAGLGWLVTGPAAHHWPLSGEPGAEQALADHRSAPATGISGWFSVLAGTEAVIGVALVCVVALVLLPGAARRADALFLGVSVAAQSAVFLVVTALVARPRPAVPRLDGAPPTSSFPSGHVGASLALYGGLAVLAFLRMRGPWRHAVAGVLLLIPLAVGMSRMYRGMHHPSDVAGGLLNGALTLLIVGWAFLTGRRTGTEPEPGSEPESGSAPGPRSAPEAPPALAGGTVLVVRHPLNCPDRLADRVRAALDARGHRDQQWLLTSAERPSADLAERAAAGDPALVVVCGGDGTVRACADVLAGTGIAMVLAPCGTGNLLARNLGLPLDPVGALTESLAGDSFGIDVGRIRGDGLPPTRFTVMAGAGFDAAMVRDASPRLKSRMGWAAYVLSAVRHLGDPGVRLTLRIDEGRPRRRRARMVVIGNVGALQGGLPLLPGARPDSGRLEVVLFDPRGPFGWFTTAGHLALRLLRPGAPTPPGRTAAGGALEYFSATRVDVRCAVPQPRELDGDAVADGAGFTAEIEPGALRMYLPGAPGAPARPAVPRGRREQAGRTGRTGQTLRTGRTEEEGSGDGHREAGTATARRGR
ncbi:diacylglycerol kinase family protein [Streptomyces sp. NPDC048551]|uniref:diacylglycerol kinase family protein n=1 Tax=Streptomyces sp. NPDC048551 TaxID=3155758 RepID=UPI003416A4FA